MSTRSKSPQGGNQQGATMLLVVTLLLFFALITSALGMKFSADSKKAQGIMLAYEMLRVQDAAQTFINRYETEIKNVWKNGGSSVSQNIVIAGKNGSVAAEIFVQKEGHILFMPTLAIGAMIKALNINGLHDHLDKQHYYLEFSLHSSKNGENVTGDAKRQLDNKSSNFHIRTLLIRQPNRSTDTGDAVIIGTALKRLGIGGGLTIRNYEKNGKGAKLRFAHSAKNRPDFERDIPVNSANQVGLLALRSSAPQLFKNYLPTLGGDDGFFSVHGDTLQRDLNLSKKAITNIKTLKLSPPSGSSYKKPTSREDEGMTIAENVMSSTTRIKFDSADVTMNSFKQKQEPLEGTTIKSGTLASGQLVIRAPFSFPGNLTFKDGRQHTDQNGRCKTVNVLRLDGNGAPQICDGSLWTSLFGLPGSNAVDREGSEGHRGPKGPRGNKGPAAYVEPSYSVDKRTKNFIIRFPENGGAWDTYIEEVFTREQWLSCRIQGSGAFHAQQPKILYRPMSTANPGWFMVRRLPHKKLTVVVQCTSLAITAATQRRDPLTKRAVAFHPVTIWKEDG